MYKMIFIKWISWIDTLGTHPRFELLKKPAIPLTRATSSLRYVASNDLTTPQKRFGDMSKMNNRQLNSVISICSSIVH